LGVDGDGERILLAAEVDARNPVVARSEGGGRAVRLVLGTAQSLADVPLAQLLWEAETKMLPAESRAMPVGPKAPPSTYFTPLVKLSSNEPGAPPSASTQAGAASAASAASTPEASSAGGFESFAVAASVFGLASKPA
jgi:hypothetical protein